MSNPRPPENPEDERSVRAAEIALSLVDEQDRQEMLRQDPALAREVARWENDFARLTDELLPVAPAPRIWFALEKVIGGEAAGRSGQSGETVSRLREWLDSLAFWRGLAGAGLAVALLLALLMLLPLGEPAPVPQAEAARTILVSSLLPRDGPPLYVVIYDATRRTMIVVPAATAAARGRVPRLWLVPNDDQEPIAIGTADPGQPRSLVLSPEAARFANDRAGLVVTLEAADAPDAAPAQGPVVAHGRLASY